MNSQKKWYQSRTLWTNGIIIVLAGLGVIIANGDGPITGAVIAAAITAALNMALRLTTSSGIAGFAPGEDPAYRAAHDASGDPDLPNGGHPMRPTPAPSDAPPTGAAGPSLVEKLGRDMGVEPETGEEEPV